uniref:hypothetical protein n=1 Tax=Pseudochrobactrum lubricantis TaxID=558172 RepID=UPI0035D60F7A
MNVDLHLALNRRQHDLIYQRANGVGCLYPLALFFILERVVELLDALAVLQRHARVQQGRRFVSFGQEQFQFLLPLFQAHHLRIESVGSAAFKDQVEQGFEFPINLRDLGFRRGNTGAAFHS